MRYLPLTPEDRKAMLAVTGAASIDDFYADVPEAARLGGKIDGLPDHQGELAVERHRAAREDVGRHVERLPSRRAAGYYGPVGVHAGVRGARGSAAALSRRACPHRPSVVL